MVNRYTRLLIQAERFATFNSMMFDIYNAVQSSKYYALSDIVESTMRDVVTLKSTIRDVVTLTIVAQLHQEVQDD